MSLTVGGTGRAFVVGSGGNRVISRLIWGSLAVWWSCTLYAYIMGNENVFQLLQYYGTYCLSLEMMIHLKHSTFQLACRCYSEVVTVLTPSFLQGAANTLEVYCGSLSVSTVDGILKLATQFSTKILAILVAVVLAVEIALASLE